MTPREEAIARIRAALDRDTTRAWSIAPELAAHLMAAYDEAVARARAEAENIRAELAAAQANLAKVLAAAEPVADALRDIAGSGHGVYLAAYQAAVEAIGYEWAKNPKPPAPRPVGWFRLNGVEFHPVDGTAEERERAVAVLTRALGVKMYPKPAGGA